MTISISLTLSISVLFILLMHLTNGAQFLKVTPLSLSCARLAANNCTAVLGAFSSGSGPAFSVIVIVPFTSMYPSA